MGILHSFVLSALTNFADLFILHHIRDGYNYAKPEEGKLSNISSIIKNTLDPSNPFEDLCELFRVIDPFIPNVSRQMGLSVSISANEVNLDQFHTEFNIFVLSAHS